MVVFSSCLASSSHSASKSMCLGVFLDRDEISLIGKCSKTGISELSLKVSASRRPRDMKKPERGRKEDWGLESNKDG